MDRIEAMVALLPAVILLLGLVCALIVYQLKGAPGSEPEDGSWLVPGKLRGFFYWMLTPLVGLLVQRAITPNAITSASVVLALCAAIVFGLGHMVWGAWLFGAAAACDGLDGLLARHAKMSSRAGAFLDSFADRLTEGMIYLGLAFYGQGSWLTWTAIAALLGSYSVSYARARGESLGVKCAHGLMQRPERLVVLFVATLGSPFFALYLEPGQVQPVFHLAIWGLALIAAGSLFTALSRARRIFDALRVRDVQDVLDADVGDEPMSAPM